MRSLPDTTSTSRMLASWEMVMPLLEAVNGPTVPTASAASR